MGTELELCCAQLMYSRQETGGEHLTLGDAILNFLRRGEGRGVRNGRRSEIVYITAADMREIRYLGITP